MNRVTLVALVSLLSTLLCVPLATAATLAAQSSADVQIQAGIADLVRISSLDDIRLNQFDGSNDLSAFDFFCVYRNGGGTYRLTASTSEGAFELAQGDHRLPYRLSVFTNFIDGGKVDYEQPLTGLSQANTQSVDCQGRSNAFLLVEVSQEDLLAAPAGDYVGTLTLTIAPE